MTVDIWPDADSLAQGIADRLVEHLASVQADGRTPSVVLTGGTIAIAAYERIQAGDVDWSSVDFYWGDERFVPAGHADRNDQQARDAFLTRLGVPEARIHAMPAHGCSESMAEAADGYAATLPADPFDLVLHGVGPDGHIASLFPGFPQVHETTRRAVEVFDSPKPPPQRISLTYPALNHARSVWLIVSGEGKAEAVARAVGGADVDSTPAAGAAGLDETVWLLDEAAASKLPA
ncbi:6-phosphogluconolactonase [Aeromicrobium wangtongii]|uniref:6-phosphogluconolactonase n=1 Tax=Aeromicrobium wangtongii TaxID=2969247 RepID=A0ABY5MDL7_9ACTN|nr:6-phosphogluconolactonase [Aeromicrobium wangtongii]MCD9197843.1 6-phosphogluconolactonase [Aeromicrobium wangtongii]UUP15324.1 6-phosphogluconolactonase [Aeromicrobium wangtongii]